MKKATVSAVAFKEGAKWLCVNHITVVIVLQELKEISKKIFCDFFGRDNVQEWAGLVCFTYK